MPVTLRYMMPATHEDVGDVEGLLGLPGHGRLARDRLARRHGKLVQHLLRHSHD